MSNVRRFVGSDVYFTSDTHFGHSNIIKYCTQPFLSEAELKELLRVRAAGEKESRMPISAQTLYAHDETILANINEVVPANATLIHLGDFCWGKTYDDAKRWLDRINCKDVILVKGNHDAPACVSAFKEVHNLFEIEVDGQYVSLCHFPMSSWNRSNHGSWHLFGHLHSPVTRDDHPELMSFDAGVDGHDFEPYSWAGVVARMQTRENWGK